ncbi:MAG: AraC family transcriptional regulator, partial [Sneathiellales bacterium]|nr:AraC family transcriptional regulator [Sneathiellales bacterium]
AIRFHFVKSGSCIMEIPGEGTVRLCRGDIILLLNGNDQFVCASEQDKAANAVPLPVLLEQGFLKNGVLKVGQEPPVTSLLCGICEFDPHMNHPILEDLPNVIIHREATVGADPWLATALRLLSLEVERFSPSVAQGVGAILMRAVEIILIQSVRILVSQETPQSTGSKTSPAGANGFLAALGNRHLSRALSAIHQAPELDWNLNSLARKAGLSRSAFALAFAENVGQTPMNYLASWRILTAIDMLRTTRLPVEEIAARVGYSSTAAFSRRFKRICGVGPGTFRKTLK